MIVYPNIYIYIYIIYITVYVYIHTYHSSYIPDMINLSLDGRRALTPSVVKVNSKPILGVRRLARVSFFSEKRWTEFTDIIRYRWYIGIVCLFCMKKNETFLTDWTPDISDCPLRIRWLWKIICEIGKNAIWSGSPIPNKYIQWVCPISMSKKYPICMNVSYMYECMNV